MIIDLVNGKNSNNLKTIVYSVSDLDDLAEEIITNVLASQYRNVASYNPLKDGGLITVNGGQNVGRKLLTSFKSSFVHTEQNNLIHKFNTASSSV